MRYDIELKTAGNTHSMQVGGQALEMLQALQTGPATRLDLLNRGHTGLALSATGIIAYLRRQAVLIESEMVPVETIHGKTRVARYHLRSRVLTVSKHASAKAA